MDQEKISFFEKMYQKNFSYIYNYIYMRVLHRETAEEICSEVFFRAFKNIESYDPKIAGQATWLCSIARNQIINYFQSNAVKRVELVDELPEIPVEDDYGITRNAINREVERILKMLSDEEREILSLHYAMDMSVKELAQVKGVSQNAMTHRLMRIREKCRRFEEESGNKFSDFFS